MEKNLQDYVVSMNYFLIQLGVSCNYEIRQKWSHVRLLEVLHDLGMEHLICGVKQELPLNNETLERSFCSDQEPLDQKIRTGKILQVRDDYGKIRHYRSFSYTQTPLPVDPVLLEDQKKRTELAYQEVFKQVLHDLSELKELVQTLHELEERIAFLGEQIMICQTFQPTNQVQLSKKYPKRKNRIRHYKERERDEYLEAHIY